MPAKFELIAPCFFGCESTANFELRRIGAEDIRVSDGRLTFRGGADMIAAANLNLRTVERVMLLLNTYTATTFDELFDGVYSIRWEELLPADAAFPVTGSSLNSQLSSVPACQSIIKKAVVKRLMQGFSNTWMHTGMLLVDGEKMSKSLGNFFTLAEVLEQHSAAALRLLMLQTSYRSPLDFSWERLEGAENSLTRIAGTVENLRWAANHATADADEAASETFAAKAAETRATFKECMDDDFNTAGAMGAVFGFVTECNQYLEQAGDAADKAAVLAAADTLAELLDTFGVELPEPKVELPLGLLGVAAGLVAYTGDDVDEAASKILEARAEARAAKNWDLADAIRDQLKDLGLTIEDTAAGTRIKSL